MTQLSVDTERVERTFKILTIGDPFSGKSSILMRFVDDQFDEDCPSTIGVDFKMKTITISGKRIKLSVWDTAGQERYRTLTGSYYRGAHGVILVFDVTRRQTFDNLNGWLREIRQYCTHEQIVCCLVGNKVDKVHERQVSREEAENFAKQHAMMYIECSAKSRLGIQQTFEELVRKITETPSLYNSPDALPGGGGGIKQDIAKKEPVADGGMCCG